MPGSTGPQGVQGLAGTVGTIIGTYQSLEALQTAVPTGKPGEFYYISPDLYIWDSVNNQWKNIGPIAGPQGVQGLQGVAGPQGAAGPTGPQGAAGPQGFSGARGAPGPTGPQGIQGVQGRAGTIGTIIGTYQNLAALQAAVPSGKPGEFYYINPDLYIWDSVSNQWKNIGPIAGPQGVTGPQGLPGPKGSGGGLGDVVSANLSVPGRSLSAQAGSLIYKVSHNDAGSVRVELSASSGKVVADVNKFSQYNTNNIDATSWDNTTFTTTPTVIDAIVYNRSNEHHVTRIRQQDPATGQWNLYVVHLFTSAGGTRTDVWVQEIGTELTY
jgi:hypothetical protein